MSDDGQESVNLNRFIRVYNEYRTSLLNVKYYGHKLCWAERANLLCELAIGLSAASGVSGWAIWGTGTGAYIWSIIAGAAALSATIKPILPLTKNISTYSKLYGGYNSNYLAIKDLVERIPVEGGISKEMEREFDDLTKQQRALAIDEEPGSSKRLIKKFQAEVNREIPPETLWCPKTRCAK